MADELRVAHDAVYDALEELRLAMEELVRQHDLETIGLARKDLLAASNALHSKVADLGIVKVGRAYYAARKKYPYLTQEQVAEKLDTTQRMVSYLLGRYREIEEPHE